MLNRKHLLTNSTYFIRKVKNLLGYAQSKELLTFLFFLCLSFLFWILQSMNEEGEANFVIPIEYKNIPEGVVLTQTPPDELRLKLRDKGIILLNYSFGNRFTPLVIDFKQYENNKGIIYLQSDQLGALIKKQLNPGSTILAIRPDTVAIFYARQGSKKVPVQLDANLNTGPQAIIAHPIQLIPDSVQIYAPEPILDTLKVVHTQSLKLTNLTDTVQSVVSLLQPYGTKVVPSQVKVLIPVEEYTEKILNLPLNVLGLPDSLALRTFPSLIRLSCFVTLNNFKDLSPDLFEVGVHYNEISTAQGNKIAVELIRKPENISNIRIFPDSVEFIIEEKEIND